MTFLENEDVLDGLDVQYNRESFAENIEDSFDDSYDDSARDSYDDSYDDTAEFLPLPLIGGAISKGIGAVSNLLNKGRSTSVNLTGVRPGNVSTGGIDTLSQLIGSVTNAAGRQFQVRVPGAATSENVNKIKQAIEAQNQNIKKISDAVNKNAAETAKIATEINRVDSKHIAASKAQNKVLDGINSQYHKVGKRINGMGRHIERLEKNVKEAQSQTQMMAMLPMLMNSDPQINTINFSAVPQMGNNAVASTTFAAKDDNTFLIMMMMMGGFGGSSNLGGMGDMMMPMMMLALK